MKSVLTKMKSRKFLTCVAGVILGICMVFGLEPNDVNTIAGAVTSVTSILTYILIEGRIDNTAVIKQTVDNVADAVECVNEINEEEDY